MAWPTGSCPGVYLSRPDTASWPVALMKKPNSLLENTPGTVGGPGGRDQTLAVKRR